MGADAFRTAHSIHHPENPPFPPALHNAIVAVQSICQQCNLSADSAYMHAGLLGCSNSIPQGRLPS